MAAGWTGCVAAAACTVCGGVGVELLQHFCGTAGNSQKQSKAPMPARCFNSQSASALCHREWRQPGKFSQSPVGPKLRSNKCFLGAGALAHAHPSLKSCVHGRDGHPRPVVDVYGQRQRLAWVSGTPGQRCLGPQHTHAEAAAGPEGQVELLGHGRRRRRPLVHRQVVLAAQRKREAPGPVHDQLDAVGDLRSARVCIQCGPGSIASPRHVPVSTCRYRGPRRKSCWARPGAAQR